MNENIIVRICMGFLCIFIFTMGSIMRAEMRNKEYEGILDKRDTEIEKLKTDLQTSYNTISDLRNENQECEYFIVPTEDGFIIDGQLYEKVEGFEAYE